MSARFYVIPVAANGSLPDDLRICATKAQALEAALENADRHAGLVVAEESAPYEELELIRVVGRVDRHVLDTLVA